MDRRQIEGVVLKRVTELVDAISDDFQAALADDRQIDTTDMPCLEGVLVDLQCDFDDLKEDADDA